MRVKVQGEAKFARIIEIRSPPLKPLCYKAFLSIIGDSSLINKEKQGNRKTDFQLNKAGKCIYRIRALSVFMRKNGKALKRSKHKGFCIFLLYGMLIVLLKYGESKAKRAKNCIFRRLKALQYKGLREIWSQRRFLRVVKVICQFF